MTEQDDLILENGQASPADLEMLTREEELGVHVQVRLLGEKIERFIEAQSQGKKNTPSVVAMGGFAIAVFSTLLTVANFIWYGAVVKTTVDNLVTWKVEHLAADKEEAANKNREIYEARRQISILQAYVSVWKQDCIRAKVTLTPEKDILVPPTPEIK